MTDTTKRQPAGIPVGGQFASHDRPDSNLTLSAPPAMARVRLEAWDGRDELIELDVQSFDIRPVLDSLSLDDIETARGGGGEEDHLYLAACAVGIVDQHDGPFTLYLDDETIDTYLEDRAATGLTEPVAPLRFMPKVLDQKVGRALVEAYEPIRLPWLLSPHNKDDLDQWQRSFAAAAAELDRVFDEPGVYESTISAEDRKVMDKIRMIASGRLSTRGFREDAIMASATLADWLIGRDEVLDGRA